MLTRLKSWLARESPLERHIRTLELENARLIKQNAGFLNRLLAREGFAPIAPEAPAPAVETAKEGQPFEDDEVLREADEQKEIEEKAQLASRDPDYMDQVVWNVESGDRRWDPILKRAEELMEKAH